MTSGLAAALRGEAAAKRITYARLAELSGIPERTLVRYMTGERDIKVSALVKLADGLGVPVSYLFAEAERRGGDVGDAKRAEIVGVIDDITERGRRGGNDETDAV